MRKKNKERENTTTNMMFLCEANVNVANGTIVKLPASIVDLKLENNEVKVYRDETPLNAKVVDFGSLYADMVDDLSTVDFWNGEFLKEIAEKEYHSRLTLSNAISSNGKKGYVLEAVISFPNDSDFYIKWNEERARKGRLYMQSLSNF